jgi:DNA gyrase subunit B
VRTHHGTPHVTAIDSDLIARATSRRFAPPPAVLLGLILPARCVRRGEKQQAVKSFKEALDWLLADARGA